MNDCEININVTELGLQSLRDEFNNLIDIVKTVHKENEYLRAVITKNGILIANDVKEFLDWVEASKIGENKLSNEEIDRIKKYYEAIREISK